MLWNGRPRSGGGTETDRLARLPRRRVLGFEVAVATDRRSRLLGLALLPPQRAGAGLLLPRCRAIHTFGMRFPLDVVFLDAAGRPLRWVLGVRAGRLLAHRRARSVLELSSANGPDHPEASEAAPRGGEEVSADAA
jgi:uncharacterized protein